jgi:hypothetical protein
MRSATVRPPSVHLLAALLGGLVLLGWAAALALVLASAGAREDRSGELMAVFPRGTAEAEALARVARAGGVVMRGTWLPNVWQVFGAEPRFAGALRAQGAVLVLPPLPFEGFAMGGCSFGAVAPLQAPRAP